MRSALAATIAIARATLWRKRSSLLALALGAGLFHYILVASYPAIGGIAAVEGVVRTFPPGLRRLLKIAPNLQAGFGLANYVALGFFHPVFLGFGSAFVVGRAADALAGEIERGAIYLLLSRPVPRWTLVLGKLLELTLGAGLIALLAWLGMAIGVWTTALPEALPLERYLLIALLAWLLFTALGAGGLLISSRDQRSGRVVGVATAWTLISFLLDVIPAIAESPLAALNPWHHYDPQAILATGAVAGDAWIVLCAWIIGATFLAALIFNRRDLA
jgi:ABC-type transport system involved in multi-copper enzyme maturation permease subunit